MVVPGQSMMVMIMVMMVSGDKAQVKRRSVVCGESIKLPAPRSKERTHNVVWSFTEEIFIDLQCEESKDKAKIQKKWAMLPDGGLQLFNVTRSDQGRYKASITDEKSSIINTVTYNLYMRTVQGLNAASTNNRPANPPDDNTGTFNPGAVVGIVLGIVIGLVITGIITTIIVLKRKEKVPESPLYENTDIPHPHIYENAAASIQMGRTDSTKSVHDYETLTQPDGVVYLDLTGNAAAS